MLREHQFLHDLATATLARLCFRARFSQSGSLIIPPEPLQRNAVWGIILYYIILDYIILYYVMLCYVVLCYAMLCYVMLC